MKRVLALVLGLGIAQFSFAQGETNQDLKECPDASINQEINIYEDQATGEQQPGVLEDTAAAKLEEEAIQEGEVEVEEDVQIEEEMEYQDDFFFEEEAEAEPLPEEEQELQEGEAELQFEDEPMEYEMESEMEVDTTAALDVEEQEVEVEEQEVEVECPDDESTLGSVLKAPVKAAVDVGEGIGSGAITIVSEVGEGVGHIVGAPFKGIASAFGREDNDNECP